MALAYRAMPHTADVLCIGHACLDLALGLDDFPGADEKAVARMRAFSGGGPAATAACAIARLGGRACFAGRAGRDPAGDFVAREFARFGVCAHLVRTDDPTPVSAVFVRLGDGARTLANHRPPARLAAPDAPRGVQARVLLADGHEPEATLPLLGTAPLVLDAGSLHEGTRMLAPKADVLAASERFARELAGTDDPAEMLAALAELAPRACITFGAHGLVWAEAGRTGAMPAWRVDAVDTTGAGDVFHGALALALARGAGFVAALRYASAAAAIACTGFGARARLPREEEVQALMATGRLREEDAPCL